MTLSIKKSNSDFTNKTIKDNQGERVYRIFLITVADFKKLRLISLEMDISLYELLNTGIEQVLKENNIKIKNTTNIMIKKSFAINKKLADELKHKSIKNELTVIQLMQYVFIKIINSHK